MSETELTEELIAAAMAKADAKVCVGNPRYFARLDPVHTARKTCTPKGRCKGGRESWDVRLEVSTGLVKLVPQAEA